MRKGGETMWLFDWLALIGIVLAIAIGVFAVVAEIWLLVIAAVVLFVCLFHLKLILHF